MLLSPISSSHALLIQSSDWHFPCIAGYPFHWLLCFPYCSTITNHGSQSISHGLVSLLPSGNLRHNELNMERFPNRKSPPWLVAFPRCPYSSHGSHDSGWGLDMLPYWTLICIPCMRWNQSVSLSHLDSAWYDPTLPACCFYFLMALFIMYKLNPPSH